MWGVKYTNWFGILVEFINQIKKAALKRNEKAPALYFFSKKDLKVRTNKNIEITINKPWTAWGDLNCKASANPNNPDPISMPNGL